MMRSVLLPRVSSVLWLWVYVYAHMHVHVGRRYAQRRVCVCVCVTFRVTPLNNPEVGVSLCLVTGPPSRVFK